MTTMNKELEEELIEAMKSLLIDIESMHDDKKSTWFGPFSECDGSNVEWPNLAMSSQALKDVLAKIESQEKETKTDLIRKAAQAAGISITDVTLPHWHKDNPWSEDLVYVSIEELADCALSRGYGRTRTDVLEQWSHYGIWLDAYILDGQMITAGIRFGPEPGDYLSPGFYGEKLRALLEKHKVKP